MLSSFPSVGESVVDSSTESISGVGKLVLFIIEEVPTINNITAIPIPTKISLFTEYDYFTSIKK